MIFDALHLHRTKENEYFSGQVVDYTGTVHDYIQCLQALEKNNEQRQDISLKN